MNIEDIKKIWDSHDQKNIFVVNESLIHREIIDKNHRLNRSVNIFEWSMMVILLALAAVMIVEGIVDREYYQLPEGGILLVAVGYLFWDRKKRVSIKKKTDNSVIEQLQGSIHMLEHHTARQRAFIWWFVLPIALTTLIHFAFTYDGKPWWIWPLTASSLIFSNWLIRKEIGTKWLPQKNELEALKKLITE